MKKLLLLALFVVGCDNSTEPAFPTDCMITLETETCAELEALWNQAETAYNTWEVGSGSYSLVELTYTTVYSCWQESCE